jgi:plastocyanin
MPAFLDLQCPCRKLSLLAFAVLLYVAAAAPARAQVPTPTIVPGNCANSYPVRNGLQFDLVLTTQDTQPSPNYWYDDQDSVTKHSEFFSGGNPGPTVSFTTICVGDDVRWEEPATQVSQHTSTQGTVPSPLDCAHAHAESPLWDIVDCVQNPTNNLMAANTIYCPAAGTCPGTSPNPFFKTQGIFQYYCRAHGSAMEGYVIVNPYKTTVAVTGATAGVYGTTSTLVATISSTPSRGGSPNAVGTVQFFINGSPFGSPVSVDSAGKATLSNAILPAGNDQVTAQYSGDGNKYAQSPVSSADTVTITPASASVSLQSSQNPAPPGTNITFTATVTNNSTAVAPGAGEMVDIFDSVSGQLGTMTFQSSAGNQGTYTFSTNALSSGSHSITAVLQAGNFSSATSNVVTQKMEDFNIAISNPVGTVAPGAVFTYNGTLTSIGGYSGNVAIACMSVPVGLACTPPGSPIALTSSSSNVPFTVTASDNTAAVYNFNIQGSDSVAGIAHQLGVTLNVTTFTLTVPVGSQSTTVVDGNSSNLLSFSVQSQGAPDTITMSCPTVTPAPAAGSITCAFANGKATQTLDAPVGVVVPGNFTIDVSATVPPGTYTVKLKAADANTSKSQNITVTVSASSTPVTLVPDLPTAHPLAAAQIGMYSFLAKVSNTGLTAATSVHLLLTFDQPVLALSGAASCTIITSPLGSEVQASADCNMGTVNAGTTNSKLLTVVVPVTQRNLAITNRVSSADTNNVNPPIFTRTQQFRLLPWTNVNKPAGP